MVESLRRAPEWEADDLPVETVQTHISVVLLGRRLVLKLKKPVDFGFLDFTTPEKRRRACEREVSLNRRLCPDIYLGVQPVSEVGGQFRLTDAGRVVDYGVLMKRLPQERMLDRMVAQGLVTEAIIDRVADRLVAFHQAARRGPEVDTFGSPGAIRRNWEENFTQTAPYIGRTVNATAYHSIRHWITRRLEDADGLLRERVRQGRICDGHGDLRSESICVTDGICIFDCVEFNERFRCGDVAGEAAFLAMDLDARGRPDLGYYFAERYQGGDPRLFALLPFYKCYRAFVRGKVLSFRLDEPEFAEAERRDAAARARNFFDLARRYAAPLRRPTVIAVAGLSGSGKTAVARAVAGELGLRVVSSDRVRRTLFAGAEGPYGYGEGPYSAEGNRLTYRALADAGRALLREDGGVVLDATFRRAADRALAREMAAAAGARLSLIECVLSPELARSRLDSRAARREGFSEATWATYERQRVEFEPVDESFAGAHFVLDTGESLSRCGHAAADWLRESEAQQ
jgi:aminoglycoside phosphotransferase family enzyme/predicted kinase